MRLSRLYPEIIGIILLITVLWFAQNDKKETQKQSQDMGFNLTYYDEDKHGNKHIELVDNCGVKADGVVLENMNIKIEYDINQQKNFEDYAVQVNLDIKFKNKLSDSEVQFEANQCGKYLKGKWIMVADNMFYDNEFLILETKANKYKN